MSLLSPNRAIDAGVAELSPKLELDIVDFYAQPEVAREFGIDKVPATVIGDGKAARIKFYGIPMGYELATVIEDIKTVSRGVSPLSMDTRKRLRQVNQPVHLQVFVTPA
jgi:alkyl hydroperoxide reductase subunit AhpF